MGSNGMPNRLERSLSLTSEPRTLTRQQYDMVRAIASMQAMERQQQQLAGANGAAQNEVTKGKADGDDGKSGAAVAKLPA